MKRRILAGFLLLVILVLVGITLAGVLEVVTKIQFNKENADYKNVSGTILNMSETIPNGGSGIDYITNVSYMWQLTSNHSYMGNKTVSNVSCGLADCANLSVFNTSFITTTLPDGRYNISLMLWNVSVDGPTNIIMLYNYSVAINVTVDNTVPQVTALLPASGGNYNIATGNISFTASVIDATAGVVNVFFYFDNASNAPSGLGFNVTATNWSGIWNVSYNVSKLHPGRNTVKVIANDSAGNVNNTISMTFTVNTPPAVTIVSPASGQSYNFASSNQTFNVTITGNVSLMGTVYLMFNNATGAYFNVSAALDARGQQWNVSYNVSKLHGGAHTVTVFANDTLGNWNNTVSTTFTVNTPPAVTIVSPASGQNYTIASSNQTFNITITGNVSLMGTVYLMFNNATGAYFNVSAALDARGQQWNVSYNVSKLHGGAHTVTVFANDTLGNWNNTVSTTFTVNAVPFSVTISAPTGVENYSLSKGNVIFNITILGNTTPLDTVYLMFDNATGNDFNRTMTNSSGKWWVSYNVSSLVEGIEEINRVTVFVNDTSGHWNNTVSVTFSMDYTAPSVTLTRSSSSTTSQLVISVSTATDTVGTCSSTPGNVDGSGNAQTLTYTGLEAGKSYTFSVSCIDEAGNVGGESGSFTTDSETGTGGGSSGSGGGQSAGVAGEFGKKVWTSINAGETATVEVANGELGVTDVSFKVTNTVWGAWLKVAKVDTMPSSIGSIDGKVYKNLQVTKGPVLKDELIKEAKIDFKVEKTWLTQNNIDTQNVALFHYDGVKWNALETTMASQDALYAYYSASVPGFSYFVIGEKTAEEALAAEEAAVEEVAEEAVAEEVEEAGEAAVEEETNWGLALLIILAVFVVVVLVAVYLKKKR